MLEEIIAEYKFCCSIDHYNRKKLFCRNKIQCELIKSSGLTELEWINRYGAIFENALLRAESKENIEKLLYKKRVPEHS